MGVRQLDEEKIVIGGGFTGRLVRSSSDVAKTRCKHHATEADQFHEVASILFHIVLLVEIRCACNLHYRLCRGNNPVLKKKFIWGIKPRRRRYCTNTPQEK